MIPLPDPEKKYLDRTKERETEQKKERQTNYKVILEFRFFLLKNGTQKTNRFFPYMSQKIERIFWKEVAPSTVLNYKRIILTG